MAKGQYVLRRRTAAPARDELRARNEQRRPDGTPLLVLAIVLSGGAGNRTRVREWIHHSYYVRSPPLDVSARWLADDPLADKPSYLRRYAEGERTS